MRGVYLGTDCGGTTAKTGGVWDDGTPISQDLRQSPTNSKLGTATVIKGWVEGVRGFMADNNISWDQVRGVGLALPGPYLEYGVLGQSANLPKSFKGWNFRKEYSEALGKVAGRTITVTCGNDGDAGGVGEAANARGSKKSSVLLLAAGSGLGAAYVDSRGLALTGDHFAGMEGGHMPAPLHLLDNIAPFACGCGRDWGCVEAYTTISGLPQMLKHFLPKHPGHELHNSTDPIKKQVLSLRDRAQEGDKLALDIFDLQARALGLHIANLTIAFDAEYVIIGGGLIDPEATTKEFRDRYLGGIRKAATPYFFPMQKKGVKIVEAKLGELSQAIGAALVSMYTAKAKAPTSKL